MCVPDANLLFILSFFFFFLFPSLLPLSCSSLSFLVKLEQLDLGGNDLEVLVGEGWWGGNMGGWKGRNPVPLWKQVGFRLKGKAIDLQVGWGDSHLPAMASS